MIINHSFIYFIYLFIYLLSSSLYYFSLTYLFTIIFLFSNLFIYLVIHSIIYFKKFMLLQGNLPLELKESRTLHGRFFGGEFEIGKRPFELEDLKKRKGRKEEGK